MTAEEFETLIASLEELAKRDPLAYKFRVAALAVLAYAYVFSTLCVFAGLIFSCLVLVLSQVKLPVYFQVGGFQVGFVLLYLLLIMVCRSFLVRFSPPRGVPVSSIDSPKIFELVNELRDRLECPRIDGVFLNADFNASVYSMPELGLFSNHKHYLCVGLPLMQSLSPEHFRAVLAHELGHLSGNHGKFASWIYSVKTSSAQLLDLVRKQSAVGGFLLKKFLEWYYPYFNAYSMVLIRQHEFEADRCAAELTGPRAAAFSLINCELKNRFVDLKYWKEMFKHVNDSPLPPPAPFHDLSELMSSVDMDPEAYKWYQEAIARKTSTSQSHPALKERIQEIAKMQEDLSLENLSEEDLRSCWGMDRSAAQEYFQGRLPDYERRMDMAWHHAYDNNWRMLHEERVQGRNQLARYDEKVKTEKLSDEELLHRAQLYVEMRPCEEAIAVLKEALERMPENILLNYNLGERLIANGDRSGVEILEKVIELKPVYGLELTEIIYQHLMDIGDEAKARIYLARSFRFKQELQKAAQERAGLKPGDRYKAHEMDEQQVELIVKQISAFPEVNRAFLVCKSVATLRDRPFYVLIIEIKFPLFRMVELDEKNSIVRSLGKLITLPSEGYVIDMSWAPGKLRRALSTIPNALIYKRAES